MRSLLIFAILIDDDDDDGGGGDENNWSRSIEIMNITLTRYINTIIVNN